MTLEERIMKTLKNNLQKAPDITPKSRLNEDLALDSFDRLMIVSALEDEFSMNIEIEDFSEFATVNDIIEKFKQMIGEE